MLQEQDKYTEIQMNNILHNIGNNLSSGNIHTQEDLYHKQLHIQNQKANHRLALEGIGIVGQMSETTRHCIVDYLDLQDKEHIQRDISCTFLPHLEVQNTPRIYCNLVKLDNYLLLPPITCFSILTA